MRSAHRFWAIVCCVGLVCGAAWAAPRARVPHRYLPGSLDDGLVQVTSPRDGVTWSAWAYRSGGEFDIAVSSIAPDGFWSEPIFFGARDRRDQTQPSLAVDQNGNVYLAFSEDGRVMLSTLRTGARSWTRPAVLDPTETTSGRPALRVVRDRLVVGYETQGSLSVVDLPLANSFSARGIVDNPDPIDQSQDDSPDPDEWNWPDDDAHYTTPRKE